MTKKLALLTLFFVLLWVVGLVWAISIEWKSAIIAIIAMYFFALARVFGDKLKQK